MSHLDRLEWLMNHGFLPEQRTCTLPTLGTCLWVDGNKGQRPVSLWLSVRDGVGIIHGVNDKDLSWEELQEWIAPTVEPAPAKKSLPGQRNLFGDDD